MQITTRKLMLPVILGGLALLGSGHAQAPKKEGAKPRPTDAEYIRRIYLDLKGQPASQEEVEKFVADADPKKREKLIDWLLAAKADPLEKRLAQALEHNPDILVARSKVQSAEAELNRVRLQVTQKLTNLHRDLRRAREAAAEVEARFEAAQKLKKNGAISQAEFAQAQQAVLNARAHIAEIEGDINFVVGISRAQANAKANAAQIGLAWLQTHQYLGHDAVIRDAPLQAELYLQRIYGRSKPGSMTERLRQAFDKPVKLKFADTPIEEVFKSLQAEHDVPFVMAVNLGKGARVNLDVPKVPLGAGLQALEDFVPGIRLVVRDYGILVTSSDRLPQGAISVHDFWKASKSKQDKEKAKEDARDKK